MEENRTTISSDDAALLIQKWYRNKRELEYQACNDNMEPEIVVLSDGEMPTCAISEENVDEEEHEDDVLPEQEEHVEEHPKVTPTVSDS